MTETTMAIVLPALALVLLVAVLLFTSRRSRRQNSVLADIAEEWGWTEVRLSSFIRVRVEGLHNGIAVSMTRKPRNRSLPERLTTFMAAPARGRMIVTRHFAGFLSNRPWFGPPIVDHPELWVRTGERMMARRLFDDPGLTALVKENLITRGDELRVDGRGIRIHRELDRSLWGFDEAAIRKAAREEWDLVTAMSRM
ncbi:MAG TPA: hypothetical protein VMS98_03795 [Thermoanaerobaculia bacterium]|nr:hypothetical protein [Thermoanaerobaculia bacterium]